MKRLVLAFGILVSVLSVGMGAMSEEEQEERFSNVVEQIRQRSEKAVINCIEGDKSACQAGLVSVEECSSKLEKGLSIEQQKNTCIFAGLILLGAEAHKYNNKHNKHKVDTNDIKDAMKYFESGCDKVGNGQAIACLMMGDFYREAFDKDYHKAAKFYKKGCDTEYGAESCVRLARMYEGGEGVRQDHHKAHELYIKACNLEYDLGCFFLGMDYYYGTRSVKQNRSIAKQYYGKACDLGYQLGCDKYKELNQEGY